MGKLKPIGDVVLIAKDDATETESGIALLESHKDPAGTDTGRILAINWTYVNEHGTKMFSPPGLDVSQRVLFLRKHGIAVKGSKTVVAVRQANLLAVYDDEK